MILILPFELNVSNAMSLLIDQSCQDIRDLTGSAAVAVLQDRIGFPLPRPP
jgi:hypothetical protein